MNPAAELASLPSPRADIGAHDASGPASATDRALGDDAPPPRPRLSVIVPVYNEEATLRAIVERVLRLPVGLEVILVDDGSADRSREVAAAAARDPRVRTFWHERNRGKGAAIRTALPNVRGEIVVIQDADLEYRPADLLELLALFEDPAVSVVYGSRWSRPGRGRWFSRSYLASRLLSALANALFGSCITDEPTCYKMFRASVLEEMRLAADGFDFCPEVTAKALLLGYRIHEVPIDYTPRDAAAGKKITWRDGVIAVWTLLKLRFVPARCWAGDKTRETPIVSMKEKLRPRPLSNR